MLQKLVFDKSQNVQTNQGVVREEMVALPAAAPTGTEDTQQYYRVENVNIGDPDYGCTSNILLKNGS